MINRLNIAELCCGYGTRNRESDGQNGNLNSAILQRSADIRGGWTSRRGHRQVLQGTLFVFQNKILKGKIKFLYLSFLMK